jgi:ATP-dependent DNA helicase RecQ
VRAAAIHSGLDPDERRDAALQLQRGELDLLYVAPERLASQRFRQMLAETRPSRLVVDEAHCISQWGHDFRPDYRRLAGLRAELKIPAAAFTATATPEVRRDIAQQLGLTDPLELVTGFERPNLTLAVELCRGRADKERALRQLIGDLGTPGIVYAATRKHVEHWVGVLRSLGVNAAGYHAGLADAERRRVQEDFQSGRLDVIAATNAFGMGIDKPDIRFVAHADLPGSAESYYQEAGRAGRDGLPARCTLLFSGADLRTQEFFLAGGNPEPATFRRVWRMLGDGASDEEVEDRIGPDAMARAAARTAARVLRRAAEHRGVALGEGEPPVDLTARQSKQQRDRERLDTMVRYAYGRGCRTRFIYDYFAGGARGGHAPHCGTCDVCLGWRRGTGRPITDDEYERVRIALSAVGRLSGRFGLERVAQVLVGSQSREVIDRGLDRVPTYGKLSGATLDQVRDLLNLLADAGLIERHGIEGGRPGAFVLALSESGRAVALGKERPDLPFPDAAPAPAPRKRGKSGAMLAGAADPALVERLRSWRAEEAQRRRVPAYVIFHDSTLAALAEHRPQSRAALLAVRGLGPAKLEAYGDALLELLAT